VLTRLTKQKRKQVAVAVAAKLTKQRQLARAVAWQSKQTKIAAPTQMEQKTACTAYTASRRAKNSRFQDFLARGGFRFPPCSFWDKNGLMVY
jgi:hypothetical protein